MAMDVFKSAASPQPSPPSEMEERERTCGALHGKRTLPVLFAQQLADHVAAKGSLHSKVPWQPEQRLLLRWSLRLGFATAALHSCVTSLVFSGGKTAILGADAIWAADIIEQP